MAKFDASGTDEMMRLLHGLGKETETICSMALYRGAGVAVDALREATEALPVEDFHPLPGSRNGKDPLNTLTADDQEDLLNGLGLARFEHTGNGVNTAASFEGYSRHKSKRFPKGIPLPMIARSIESGSSARKKHPFIRRAMRAKESQIQEAMEDTVRSAVDTYVATGSLPPFDNVSSGKDSKGIHKKST